jgi:hypothetical protein
MCQALTCEQCGCPTWAGCGAHVEDVLGHVPAEERCRCGEATDAVDATVAPGR